MKIKKNKSVVIIAVVIFIAGLATITPAEDTQITASDEMQMESLHSDGDFSSLLKIHRGIYEKLPGLTNEQLKGIMTEHIAFLEENQSILENLKLKWVTLAEELTKHKHGSEKAIQLQNEIVSIDNQLAAKRIEHLLVVEKMSSEPAGR